jgi:hypothetical protein
MKELVRNSSLVATINGDAALEALNMASRHLKGGGNGFRNAVE